MIKKIEYYKNLLRLTSRVIDILVLIVELYLLQKEIELLVSSGFNSLILLDIKIEQVEQEQARAGSIVAAGGARYQRKT